MTTDVKIETPQLVATGDLVRLLRPKTRGELRDALNAGHACEIPDCGVEMTSAMFRGWLDCENFTVKKSTNADWVIFEPNADVSREA